MGTREFHCIQCPTCGDATGLYATFSGTLQFLPEGTDDCGDHEYDNSNACWCDCGWSGTVGEAQAAYAQAEAGE